MELEYIVVAVSGVCLVAIVGALILSPSFRKDITAQPGKVSVLGISVEGVVIVLMTALLIGSLAYALDKYTSRKIAEDQNVAPSIKLNELPSEVEADDPAKAIEKIRDLVRKSKASASNDVVGLVRRLKYNQPESEEIRTFPATNTGPWALSGDAEETYLTIPNRIGAGEAFGCPAQLNKFYEIRARLPNDDGTVGESVVVKVVDVISRAQDCEKNFDFIQVSCDVARTVLSEKVVTCDSKNQPGWRGPDRKIPIWLTQVQNPA